MSRFFDGINEPLWMKRWQCPECHTVYTVRPDSHWRGLCATRLIILVSVMGKALTGRWLKSISRQRQQYWWRGYRRHASIHSDWQTVKELLAAGVIPATHSLTHCEVTTVDTRPNWIFAVTAGCDYG